MVVIVKLNVTAANADRIQQVTHPLLKCNRASLYDEIATTCGARSVCSQVVVGWWLDGCDSLHLCDSWPNNGGCRERASKLCCLNSDLKATIEPCSVLDCLEPPGGWLVVGWL